MAEIVIHSDDEQSAPGAPVEVVTEAEVEIAQIEADAATAQVEATTEAAVQIAAIEATAAEEDERSWRDELATVTMQVRELMAMVQTLSSSILESSTAASEAGAEPEPMVEVVETVEPEKEAESLPADVEESPAPKTRRRSRAWM